ncbi:sugar ABC transporter substrate-binding protein [Beijerinckia sp. L45]|uniref:sugar ABC transporter substrate-binding protein n=1 Tax=Beijerinckia sp. L45 TaxID=1641855 RepID=UPI00131AB77B|nr:sugar ABC transporter substrate-binding protein [Beijerinckia sp. L45]
MIIEKAVWGALTSSFIALYVASPALAEDLGLTKAEHTPLACDQTISVKTLSTFDAPKAKKRYKIELSIPSFANPYIQAVVYGAQKAAADAGVTLTFDAGQGFMDPASQITQLENALTRHPDAVLINPADPDALSASIDEAIADGTMVMDLGTLSNSTKSFKLVQDDYGQGVMAADALAKLLPRGGAGILMGGPANASWARRRVAGFIDEIKKYPSLKISAMTSEDIKPEEGLRKFANAAQAHPGIDWIYSAGWFLLPPTSIPSEYRKAVYVAGGFASVTSDALKDGSAAAILPDFPVGVGYSGVALAVAKLNGDKVAQHICAPVAAITKADLADPIWEKTSNTASGWVPPTK